MKKIISIVGARPQFIKAATISRALQKYPDICEIILHTGQHYDENMSDVFFNQMQIPAPKYNLTVNNLSHGAMTGRMLEKIEKVFTHESPDVVIVYGDTNSTLAGSLAAKKLHIPVAHIEAGLRSFNMSMPEEINRILTDRISDYLYCPTQAAADNLKKEGFDGFSSEVVLSGDVMFDAVLYYGHLDRYNPALIDTIRKDGSPFILCTLHREENTNDLSKLDAIFEALNTISEQVRVVLPIHPRTRKIISGKKMPENLCLSNPVGYFEMLELLKRCKFVMTDSGGLQKEAFFFNKYCITLRNETEWIELVNAGVNIIAGSDTSSILSAARQVLDRPFTCQQKLYGDGHAADLICNHLVKVIQ
jgi:UDP-GlcNAc3NAcA epimerase